MLLAEMVLAGACFIPDTYNALLTSIKQTSIFILYIVN